MSITGAALAAGDAGDWAAADAAAPTAHSLASLEQAVIGAAISSTSELQALATTLRPGDFSDGRHHLIFGAACALAGQGAPVDPMTVMDDLARKGNLGKAGGGAYLHTCLAVRPPDADWHARRVLAESELRRADTGLIRARQALAEPGPDAADRLQLARDFVGDALAPRENHGLRTMGEVFQAVLQKLERGEERGIASPWTDLNQVIPGLGPGELIIVGAQTSVGKSVVGGQFAWHVSVNLGLPSVLFSLEMAAEDLILRQISAAARIPLQALIWRKLEERDWNRISAVYDQFMSSPMVVDDGPGVGLAQVRGRLAAMKRTGPAQLAVVDYLQLMSYAGAENRNQAVGGLARGLKQIAREFAIPVVVLAQLNRNLSNRSDHRPTRSDLRDSGEIENHADVVILLHREEMYDPATANPGLIELIVDKQRQGPRATVSLGFQGEFTRCVDLAKEPA